MTKVAQTTVVQMLVAISFYLRVSKQHQKPEWLSSIQLSYYHNCPKTFYAVEALLFEKINLLVCLLTIVRDITFVLRSIDEKRSYQLKQMNSTLSTRLENFCNVIISCIIISAWL